MEQERIRYLLFDLDGTLTESGPGVMKGAQYALKAFGIDEQDPEKLRLFVGPPLWENFIERYGMNEEDAMEATRQFRVYYNEKGVFENAPYEGIHEMLGALAAQGFVLAVASSKPQNMVDLVLTHFSLASYFTIVVGGTDDGPLKTKEGVVKEVLRRLACRAEQKGMEETPSAEAVQAVQEASVMIGDRIYDVRGADAVGIRAIGVSWGYAPQGELEATDALAIAKDPAHLTELLLQWRTKETH